MRDSELIKSALFYDYPSTDGGVFGQDRRERVAELTDLYPHVITRDNFDQHTEALADVEVIFATWGIPRFSDHNFSAMPNLKAVFYAAGNVRSFADPLVENGVVLVGAWDINAIPVAEMCLSHILLSLRGYFSAVRRYKEMKTGVAKTFPRSGVFGETVGLIGLGKIGTRVRDLLANYPVKVIAHDPFLTDSRAKELEVESVSLEQVFERSLVVSNHIHDLKSTAGALNATHFKVMREGATFINSGRGAQVVEQDLIRVFSARPDLTALLDVTLPEPPATDSLPWNMANVVISPQVGGTIGDEVVRMADCMIDEFESWTAGRPLRYEITSKGLETMG
jgi:phosphoglycerate dehydrogenase-like enzyme